MGAPERLWTVFTADNPTDRTTRWVLWILVFVALGLRLAAIAAQPLWWDEGWSLYFATSDVPTILDLTSVDIHPPLYYLLLHAWIQVLGSSALAVRLLSVLIGTATVPLLYATGQRLMGTKGGLLAAFLLAISPFHIYYSQEVRMYELVTLLGLAASYFAIRWEQARWDPAKWGLGLGYVLAATAALYSQYYATFLLLALNLAVLLHRLRPPRATTPAAEHRRPSAPGLLPWWIAQVAVAALFVPWVWYAGGKLLTYVRFKVGVEQDPSLGLFAYVGRHLAALNWGHAEGYLADWWWLGLLPLLVLVLALIPVLWRQARTGSTEPGKPQGQAVLRWALTIVLVTILCGFAVNIVFPFNPARSERLLLLVLPEYFLLFSAGLLALWRARRYLALVPLAAFLLASLWSLTLFYTVPRYPDDDYRPVAAQVQAQGLPGDAIVNVHPWQVGYFQAYIPDDEARPTLFLTPREVIPRERQIWADDPAQMAADLDALLADHSRLWFPDHRAMGRVLERQIEAYLSERAYPVLEEWHGENTVLSLFATGEPEDAGGGEIARFGDWLALKKVAVSPGPLAAGWDVAAVDLGWQVSQPPPEDYTVGLRLVDPTGHVWAQRDALPGGGLASFSQWPTGEVHLDRHGLLVPAGTPPGDYSLILQVYRSEDIGVLPATFAGGSGGEVELGTVPVTRPQTRPPVEALTFDVPLRAAFGDRLRLLGYNATKGAVVRPGESVEVELFWQALADPGEDYLPRLQLVDIAGLVVAELAEKPVAGTYPTAWWQAGELVRDPHALPIPATVEPGHYTLALSLLRASDGTLLASDRGQTVAQLDTTIEVTGREHNYEPPAPKYSQNASFGPDVEMVGYDLNDITHSPGSTLEVTLHWHALEIPDQNYHSFVHLLDSTGTTVAQHDGLPGEGKLPALGWLPGEYLLDPHAMVIPVDLPGGTYHLGVGLYDPATDLRLGNRLILNTPIAVTDD